MRKLMVMGWMFVAATCFAQQIDLKSLDKFAARAKNKTEINMDEAMVKSAAGFLDQEKKDEALAKQSVKDLKGLYLRVYEFEGAGAFKLEDLKPLLDQLKAPNWVSFLRSQEDGEQTEIWMHRNSSGETDGLLLIAAEGDELVVINAVGSARLQDLAVLGEFGKRSLENLQQPAGKPAGQKDED